MIFSEKEFLFLFGWNDFFESQITSLVSSSLRPGRIIGEERNLYRIQLGMNEISWASLRGKLQFAARTREDYPAVGDWVLAEMPSQSDRGIIHHICARKSALVRKQVGYTSDVQVLSANIDYIFVATSLDADLNINRLERYLTLAWDSGARPIILLTKADLSNNAKEVANDIRTTFPAVDVYCISQNNFDDGNFFTNHFKKGTTSVIIGSSGIGKSTLINFLIGSNKIKTQEVRESDGKGRHTTTSRALFVSRYGGLVIDTPGMRELQFSNHEQGFQTHFGDIEELMLKCKFSNCQHQTEPGCAILEGLANETLSQDHWKSYRKLQGELKHEASKKDKALRSENRKAWKKQSLHAQTKHGGWR